MRQLFGVFFLTSMLFVGICNTFAESNSSSGATGDGIVRKYASTRMIGCDENDIILGDKVWASCNSDYNLTNSLYYNWTTTTYTNGVTTNRSYELDTNSKDINGWKYGRQYSTSIECPAGYKVPSYYDFSESINTLTDLQILKLPAAGYRPTGNGGFREKDTMGSYHVSWLPITNPPSSYYFYASSVNGDHAGYNDGYDSLRCIRSTPVTFEEKNGDLKVANNGLSMTGGLSPTSFGSGYNNSYTYLTKADEYNSKDEYVNEKLKEINDCFLSNYNAHLENINRALEKLKKEKEKQKDEKSKKKYDNAIKKLEEIKIIFIKRYKNVIDFDGIN